MGTNFTHVRFLLLLVVIGCGFALVRFSKHPGNADTQPAPATPSMVSAVYTSTPTPSPQISATTSTILPSSPTPRATLTPTPVLTYTNQHYGFSLQYPASYYAVNTMADSSTSDAYVALTTNLSLHYIPTDKCVGRYFISVSKSSNSFDTYGTLGAWSGSISNAIIKSLTVSGHAAYSITGTYNGVELNTVADSAAQITLINDAPYVLQLSLCSVGGESALTADYDSILHSIVITK